MRISDTTCDSESRSKENIVGEWSTTAWQSIVVVAGAPRSGTSWLGQILESSPRVAYRFQPFFAYASRDRVTVDSTKNEWFEFLQHLYESNDHFLTQEDKRQSGEYPEFTKDSQPPVLAFKTCRSQYLLPALLTQFENATLVPIVRHPAAVIHSWISTPTEFPEGSDVSQEWRFGACKNRGLESEFFGYYKWKELAHMYLDLHDKFPSRVFPIHYETLVENTADQVRRLFEFLELPFTSSTESFLANCHKSHHGSPFAVFKDRSVKDAWRDKLPRSIVDEIQTDLMGTRLERFIR